MNEFSQMWLGYKTEKWLIKTQADKTIAWQITGRSIRSINQEGIFSTSNSLWDFWTGNAVLCNKQMGTSD